MRSRKTYGMIVGMQEVQFESARAGDAVKAALSNGGSLAPLASYLVDAVGDRDRELLDELEALVAQRRPEARQKS